MDGSIVKHDGILGEFFPEFVWDSYSPPQRFPTKMVVYFYFMIARAAAYRPGPSKPDRNKKEVHDHFRWEPLRRRVLYNVLLIVNTF